jgi:hypothetical protein
MMRSLPETAVVPSRAYRTRAASGLRRSAWANHPWLALIALALLVKLAVVAAALAYLGAAPNPLAAFASHWIHWDAPHYLFIARNGYVTSGDMRNLIAFFPLFPALVQALAATGLPLWLAAIVLNNLGGLAATILLYELGRQDGNAAAGFRAGVLFNVFPTAYFLLNGYTEGVFCAFAFTAVLLARRERWLAAGAFGGLAALTRVTGIALLPLLAVEIWLARARLRRVGEGLLSIALVGLGLSAYLAVNWLVLRDPFAFVQVQRLHWYHRLSAPWVGGYGALRGIFWRPPWEKLTVGAGELVAGVGTYATTAISALKLRPGDAAYAAGLTVLATFLPFWLSIPRYLLSLYPLFLLLGRIRNRVTQCVITALSMMGLLVFSLAFAKGYWAF